MSRFSAMVVFVALLVSLSVGVGAQSPPEPGEEPEVMSLDGKPWYRSQLLTEEQRGPLEENLKKAEADHAETPEDADAIVWLGRRLAYLHRYHDAIDVFTRGIELHPDDARMYRHRGHRFITVRQFDRAVADLEKGAALVRGKPDEEEPSGTGGRPSTLQFGIWYHLGLARYLKGDFGGAIEAYRECMKVSPGDESKVATSDWLYMALRRNGDSAGAAAVLEPIHEGMEIQDNTAYFQRLLMYKGLLTPEAVLNPETAEPLQLATQGYGVANWYFVNGDVEKARDVLEKVIAVGYWPAFGHIAAEADLVRMSNRE